MDSIHPSRVGPLNTPLQPFSVKSGALFVLTGAGLYYYFQSEKEKLRQRKAAQTSDAKVGRPKIGGPFVLTDTDGNEWSSDNLKGKWSLVYVSETPAS